MDGDVFATPRSRAQTEGFATTPASRAPRHRAQSLSEGGYATSAPRRALTPEPARPCRGSAKRSPLKSKSSALDLEMATFDAEFAASEAAECDGGDGASLLDRAPNAKSGRAKRIARWLASGRRPSLRSAPTTRKRRCASWCLAIAGVVGVLQTATVLAMVAPPAAPCAAAPEGGPWRPPLNVYGNATVRTRRLGAARDEAAPSAKKPASRKKREPASRKKHSRVRQSDLVFWGAHNSYHKQPASGAFPWWNAAVPQWRYSHPRLSRQLDAGARHFELDVHVDSVARTARVFHVPALDARTRCGCLQDCLRSLSDWSRRRNRDHGLVWVLLEVKGTKSYLEDFYARYRGLGDPGSPEASRALGVLDDVARAVFAEFPETLLTPADLQAAGYPSPGAAVRSEGWPAAERLRGKFALALLDPTHDGALTKAYRSRPSAPMLFSMGAAADDADAALVKFDNPRNVQHFAAIAEAVAAGLIVRTRANTVKFVDNADRFAKARECGAQLVSFEADAGEGWRRFTGEDAGPLCACALPALAGSDRRCDDDAPPCGG